MGKDNRIILRTPYVGQRRIKDEDELAAALTPEQGQKLLDSGAIKGDWKFTGTEEPSSASPDAIPEAPAAVDTSELDRLKAELSEARETIDLGSAENLAQKRQITTLKGKVTKLLKELGKSPDEYPDDAIDGTGLPSDNET
jgi:hypothetical protein